MPLLFRNYKQVKLFVGVNYCLFTNRNNYEKLTFIFQIAVYQNSPRFIAEQQFARIKT